MPRDMYEDEYRNLLRKWDKETENQRVARWKQLEAVTYHSSLPDLLWEYSSEASKLYINGYFVACILLCASIAELTLEDQLKSRGHRSTFDFSKMIALCKSLGILEDYESNQLDELRELRNELAHADAGKLSKRARKYYDEVGLSGFDLGPALFLNPLGDRGLDDHAFEYLQKTRKLTERLYGEESEASE